MTFKSLTIEMHPNARAAKTPYGPYVAGPTFAWLNASFWPGSALRFANDHGLEVERVDDSWIRVPVSAKELREFLSRGDPTYEPELPDILARVEHDAWYLIQEKGTLGPSLLIENDGALFRGEHFSWPTEVWSTQRQLWVPYRGTVPKPPYWGWLVTDPEAEDLKAPL